MAMSYNDPANGSPSSVGAQQYTHFYQRKALTELAKEQFFGQMADVMAMPKHYGKKISLDHYLPLLDDANINDQGIDANGVSTQKQVTIEMVPAEITEASNGLTNFFAVGEGADDAAALTDAQAEAVAMFTAWDVLDTDYATTKAALEAEGWVFVEHDAVPVQGNLYGSSKDVGTIMGKLPMLGEHGGRVNRVGWKRRKIEAELTKYGFFGEYTKDSIEFDSDKELEMHITRTLMQGASEIVEDLLQIDLLQAAGIIRYAGDATKTSEITGEGTPSVITYDDFVKLDITLSDNRCPKQTTLITGSTFNDTRTINGARYAYCGTELLPTLEKMKDYHDERAFIHVHQYADAATLARGEEGSVGKFRIIVVPEMMHFAGEGADATTDNEGYRVTDGKYDVYPLLVVGDKSFTTVGFQTDGKTTKFKIKHVKPESDIAYSHADPYGEKGFTSIKWWYSFLPLRPERIALLKSVAEQ